MVSRPKINERWDVICPSPDAWRRNGIKARDRQSSVQNRGRLQATSSAVTIAQEVRLPGWPGWASSRLQGPRSHSWMVSAGIPQSRRGVSESAGGNR
jgi:hypothetical protein